MGLRGPRPEAKSSADHYTKEIQEAAGQKGIPRAIVVVNECIQIERITYKPYRRDVKDDEELIAALDQQAKEMDTPVLFIDAKELFGY